MSKRFFSRSRALPKEGSFACVLLLILWDMTGMILAQGIEDNSNSNQPYNLQIGPVTLRAEAGSSVSYNDNIDLTKAGRQNTLIITPNLNIHGLWQATELNNVTFDLGVSYQQYLSHSSYSSFLISPGSQTQFNIFVGDFKINLHDSFSYQQDPTQVGQLSNVAQFDRFLNDAGIRVNWDIGDMIVSLGYDHDNFWVFEQAYQYLNNQSDVVSPQVTFKLSKTMQAGLNASFSSIRYDQNIQNIQNNSTQLQAGPFVTAQISKNLSINAQGGWDYANYGHGGLNGDTEDTNSFYCSAGINHHINDVLSESLTAGREFIPGITSNYTQRIYANYMPSWKATSFLNIAPQLWWENLDDSNATIRETSNRFGANLNLGYALTDHETINLSYQYVVKRSDQISLNYYQDVIALGLNYQF